MIIPELSVPKFVIKAVKDAKKRDILSTIYPYETKMKRKDYEKEKSFLQSELLKLQHWIIQTDQRLVLLLEGRDAAGKGGTIKRFMEHLNPRNARVIALEKPNEVEKGEWYFQRYVKKLPTRGEMIFFDRSWYNRAVVEPVMGFCTASEQQKFLREAPQIENMLVNDGIHLFKFWFSVSREEQYRRFKSRENDDLKQWKVSPVDVRSLKHWHDYTRAKSLMFSATDTKTAPWTMIMSDDKKRARLNCMRYVLNKFDYPGKNTERLEKPDKKIIGSDKSLYKGKQKIS